MLLAVGLTGVSAQNLVLKKGSKKRQIRPGDHVEIWLEKSCPTGGDNCCGEIWKGDFAGFKNDSVRLFAKSWSDFRIVGKKEFSNQLREKRPSKPVSVPLVDIGILKYQRKGQRERAGAGAFFAMLSVIDILVVAPIFSLKNGKMDGDRYLKIAQPGMFGLAGGLVLLIGTRKQKLFTRYSKSAAKPGVWFIKD